MKTIEEILNEKSNENGYKHIFHALNGSDVRNFKMVEDAMQEYARQMCDEQIKACYHNSDVHFDEAGMMDGYIRTDCVAVDKDSILNTPNVVTK